jgi:glycosyltransferase involved in cell wall biosynthesis
MQKRVSIDLPNLDDYRQSFAQQGVIMPLPVVPFSTTGLLAELPPPPPGKTGWPWTVETPPMTTTMPNGLPYPKISIVTPSYNQGQFIEETIRSVLLQNYPNLEFIIMDGGSNDETKEILEKYSPWLSFWRSAGDRGQGHAINLGFSLASGDYFGWINSDDFYLRSCFYKVKDAFTLSNKDFIYGDAVESNEITGISNYWQGYFILDRHLIIGGIIASHAAFWKNSIHTPIQEEISCAIDYELWLRMVQGKSKYHLREPLGLCRIQESSKSYSTSYRKKWEEDYRKIFNDHKISKIQLKWSNYESSILHRAYKFLNRNDVWKMSQIESSLN